MTLQAGGLLTAKEAINFLAFGQDSSDDQTGYSILQKKWQAEITLQPTPEVLCIALKILTRIQKVRSSDFHSVNFVNSEMIGWANHAVVLHGRPPAELLEELELDLSPVIERRQTYQAAERRLVALLSHGRVMAVATPAQLRQPFPGPDPGVLEPVGAARQVELAIRQTPNIGIWPNGDIREAPGLVPPLKSWLGPLFVAVMLPRSEVARFRPCATTINVSASIGDRTRLRKWLIDLMRRSPEVSPGKRQVRLDATAAGHRFGVRQFDEAWRRAAEEAPAPAWSAKGRKLKQD